MIGLKSKERQIMTELNKQDALAALNTLKNFGLQEGKAGLKSAKEYGMKLLTKVHQAAADKFIEKQNAKENETKSKVKSFNLNLDNKHTVPGSEFMSGGKIVDDFMSSGKIVGMSEFLDKNDAICILKAQSEDRRAYLFATKDNVYCPVDQETNEVLAVAYDALGERDCNQADMALLTKGIYNSDLGIISTQR